MKATAKHIERADQPTVVKPMLATLIKQPFTDDDYVFEVKWDGYRIIAVSLKGKVKLQSRGGEDYTKKYPSIAKAIKELNVDCILDGEIVYINSEGRPDFDALQRVNGQKAPIIYYAFDLLWLEGQDIMKEKLLHRKARLKKLIDNSQQIKFSDHFEDGNLLFEQIQKIGMEGIVAKRKDNWWLG
jgi:bifunctional non-homologous end joining protein LigD